MTETHPELRHVARILPRGVIGRDWMLPVLRTATRLMRPRPGPGVDVTPVRIPVRGRLYRPTGGTRSTAACLWIHGGGLVSGTDRTDEATCADISRELGIVVLSVDYRLSPEHPYPIPLEDCYSALAWLHTLPGVNRGRIAVAGASAGGGLAAALAQLARDRGELPLAFQSLTYPMLDDRTAVGPAAPGDRNHRLWNRSSNFFGWSAYLAETPGAAGLTSPAVPARCDDLSGLPPAWIGVGTNDLFHDEGVHYAMRLRDAGVACALQVVPGAFHAFDLVAARSQVAQTFCAQRLAALGEALA